MIASEDLHELRLTVDGLFGAVLLIAGALAAWQSSRPPATPVDALLASCLAVGVVTAARVAARAHAPAGLETAAVRDKWEAQGWQLGAHLFGAAWGGRLLWQRPEWLLDPVTCFAACSEATAHPFAIHFYYRVQLAVWIYTAVSWCAPPWPPSASLPSGSPPRW